MSRYESKPVIVEKPAEQVFDRFNDLSIFEKQIDALPAEQRAKIGEVHFDKDSIAIITPQVGELKFEVLERTAPSKIVFGSKSSPIPLTMSINLKAVTPESTEVATVIDVEIPVMLRPFVGPKLQEAANKFGEMISNLSR